MSLPHPNNSPGLFPSLARRRFLALTGMSVWSLAALPSRCQAGLAFDTDALEIHDVTVPVPHLPRHLEGLTIAHLTDTHLRRLGRLEESVLAAVQAREPAVVVLTGDMISSRKALPLLAEFCRAVTAPGRHVLAIRGNHEVCAQGPCGRLKTALSTGRRATAGERTCRAGRRPHHRRDRGFGHPALRSAHCPAGAAGYACPDSPVPCARGL